MVLSYEFIGVQIFGLVSDAGGGNTKMFKLLQGHNAIRGPWTSAECLSFKIHMTAKGIYTFGRAELMYSKPSITILIDHS